MNFELLPLMLPTLVRKVWFIGEQNPLSEGHEMDLYPLPVNSTGGRLCHKILGVTKREYLQRYGRRNLLHKGDRWTAERARTAAESVCMELFGVPSVRGASSGPHVVLLGKKVSDAFGLPFDPFESYVRDAVETATDPPRVLILPHPSGINRSWNDPRAFLRARECVAALEAP